MRRIGYALLMVGAALSAQERGPAQPDETRIVVPELILAVEELPLDRVEATLPAEAELRLGDLALPLPEPGDLEIDQAAFFISAPETSPMPVDGSSIYSTGLLGAGSASHIVGEVSLFKLGEDPRFRLRFFYEGLDGFQFEPTGTGYFRTENQVEGSIESSSPEFDFETRALFSERVTGLQGESPFYSVGLRTLSGLGTVTWRPDPLLELSGRLDGRFASRLQSASNVASVPRDRELALAPGLGISFTVGSVVLSTDLDYQLSVTGGAFSATRHQIDGSAGAAVSAAPWLRIEAQAGVFSEFDARLFYPWSLATAIVVSESLETDLFGGYRQLPISYLDRWTAWPLLAAGAGGDGYRTPGEWFAGARVRWSPLPGIVTTTVAEYLRRENAIEIERFAATPSVYEAQQRLLQNVRLDTTVGFTPARQTNVQIEWDLLLLDRLATDPLSTLNGSVSIGSPDGRLSATLDALLEFYPRPVLPEIDITGTVAVTDGVALDLVLSDPLALLLPDGRPSVGPTVSSDFPFIEPGFRASVLARISL